MNYTLQNKMSSFTDSSSESDDDIDEECLHFNKENSVWNSPEDNRVLKSPFLSLSPTALWGDIAMELENTPGTMEYKIEKKIKKRILKEKKNIPNVILEKKREKKIIPNVILGEKNYYSTKDIAKERDKILIKNKPLFIKTKKKYRILDHKEQEFLWDLLRYHPKRKEKEKKIKKFVYGYLPVRHFMGLLALQHDGKLDSFSQRKSINKIKDILGET